MTIQYVTFDLDDTLWDVYPVIVRAENRFYEWLGEYYPQITQALDLKTMIAERQTFFKGFRQMSHDFTWLRKQWLKQIGAQFHCPHGFEEAAFEVFWLARNEVTFFEGTIPMLEAVKRDFGVISITNGNADVKQVGLGAYFDHAITAAQSGVAKPDPVIFQKALDLAQVEAHQVVHVGDDPIADVHGAAALGIKTIWANIHQKPWPGGEPADREVRYLKELLPAIKSL